MDGKACTNFFILLPTSMYPDLSSYITFAD
jgi:hypothetical protein